MSVVPNSTHDPHVFVFYSVAQRVAKIMQELTPNADLTEEKVDALEYGHRVLECYRNHVVMPKCVEQSCTQAVREVFGERTSSSAALDQLEATLGETVYDHGKLNTALVSKVATFFSRWAQLTAPEDLKLAA